MGRQNLDRDRAIEASVAGAINFSHAACAEKRLNFVWTEFVPQVRGMRRAIISPALAGVEQTLSAALDLRLWTGYAGLGAIEE